MRNVTNHGGTILRAQGHRKSVNLILLFVYYLFILLFLYLIRQK